MSEIALSMDHVFKKFRRGTNHDSLRDLLPAMAKKFFSKPVAEELKPMEFWALNDVSFEVNRGEAFGVMGHNGAGKSTLLKHLCGILKPTKGSLQVNGRLSALIEVSAGFHPDLTGRENIFLNGCILGMSKQEIRRKFDEIVDFSGLEAFIDTPVKRYSSGMFTRLGFAVGAHLEPDILIIDEVLSVGDYNFQRKSLEKIRTIIKGGASVIFVSHNLRAIAGLCQKSILMEKGRVIESGLTHQVIKRYLERNSETETTTSGKQAKITHAVVKSERNNVLYEPGDKVQLDVEVTGYASLEKLTLVVEFQDESFYPVFETSSEHITEKNFSLNKDQTFKLSFELTLHLAPGTYHVGLCLCRHDTQAVYDNRFPFTSFYISSDKDLRGVANLYPKVIAMDPC